jgi:hypothetical protein
MDEKIKSPAQINLEKLPARCYSVLLTHPELIIIQAGEKGYYKTNQAWPKEEIKLRNITMDQFADELNKSEGVTKAQREAMETGSMWGWHVPGADPDLYDENGMPIKERLHDKIK